MDYCLGAYIFGGVSLLVNLMLGTVVYFMRKKNQELPLIKNIHYPIAFHGNFSHEII